MLKDLAVDVYTVIFRIFHGSVTYERKVTPLLTCFVMGFQNNAGCVRGNHGHAKGNCQPHDDA